MVKNLVKLIKESKNTVAFTGAGVSTLSGIRDFRGVGGFYTSNYGSYQVEDLLSLDLFYKDPSLFYKWAGEFIYVLDDFEASIVHSTLAKMEEKNLLSGVYTQNIDLLHQKAGSKNVIEIHGSPANHTCPKCKNTATYLEVAEVVSKGELPLCKKCGTVVKPDIIFYGESLNSQVLQKAFDDMSKADLVLVLGSSLTVQPAASLPAATVNNGGKMVIINAQNTPLDSYVTERFKDLKETFEKLEKELGL
jgi:NAD-dependent deacetylase